MQYSMGAETPRQYSMGLERQGSTAWGWNTKAGSWSLYISSGPLSTAAATAAYPFVVKLAMRGCQ
jgi:hypothetical protein